MLPSLGLRMLGYSLTGRKVIDQKPSSAYKLALMSLELDCHNGPNFSFSHIRDGSDGQDELLPRSKENLNDRN